jgi:hypothetical protein
MASAMCLGSIDFPPSKSAIVLATFRIRSGARAVRPCCAISRSNSFSQSRRARRRDDVTRSHLSVAVELFRWRRRESGLGCPFKSRDVWSVSPIARRSYLAARGPPVGPILYSVDIPNAVDLSGKSYTRPFQGCDHGPGGPAHEDGRDNCRQNCGQANRATGHGHRQEPSNFHSARRSPKP